MHHRPAAEEHKRIARVYMSASRTTPKELLGLLARIAAACETADSIVPTGLESLYDEIIETLEEAQYE